MAAPTITITSVLPGTATPANTGIVDVTWNVSGATAIYLGFGAPGADVLPEGVVTDVGEGSSNVFPTTSGSFTMTIGRTAFIDIRAINAEGTTTDSEWFYSKIHVGYHAATVPGAPVQQHDLDRIRGYLQDVDGRLRANALTNLSSYLSTYNSRVPAGDRFPAFADIGYLSGGVGTGNLTDDLLRAMQTVLIYIAPYTMPRGWRPGTIGPGRRALCDTTEGTIYGLSTRDWVSVCVDAGADGLTLLHELFHYASRSNNGDELRAFAISMCAYNILP